MTSSTVADSGVAGPSTGDGPGRRSIGRAVIDAVTTANSWMVTILAILLAFVVGGVIIVLSDPGVLRRFEYFFSRPSDALEAVWESVSGAYSALLRGSILDPEDLREAIAGEEPWTEVFEPLSETLTYATPLILMGLAVALAFRAGMFNIGVEGQAVLGALTAALAGFGLSLPAGLHLVVALLAGIAGGALWGLIPGWLKARTGAHEVITTIMLNYIAGSLLLYLINLDGIHHPERNDAISKPVYDTALLPRLAGDQLRLNLGILIALLAAGGVAWLLQRSTIGFEFRAVGSNPDAARTAGMSVGKTYVLVMAFAGGLAGLGGASVLLGIATSSALTPAIIGGIGFDGITVALLGRARPWGVVLAGLLFGALRAGAPGMQAVADVPVQMVTILQALIVMFIAAPAFVKEVFRLRQSRAGALGQTLAKGWNG